MNNVKSNSLQGCATFGQGLFKKFGALVVGAAFFLAPLAVTVSMAGGPAITQLEYLQWLVQLVGDTSQFSSSSTAADYVQWARTKGMNPEGGWQPGAKLTKQILAQTVVQLYNINPNKQGADFERILQREGMNLPNENEISRQGLVSFVDNLGFQSRIALIAKQSGSPTHGNNGLGNGEDPPPPGWLNPRNPHFGHGQNDGPGHGPGNPSNKGGGNK